MTGHEQERRDRDGDGRSLGQAWLEQAGRSHADRAQRVGALAPDESIGLRGVGPVATVVAPRVRRSGRGGEGRRQFEGARDAVAEVASPSTARAVSPMPGRARTMATSQARIPIAGMTAAATGAQVIGMNRATVQRTSSATRIAARASHVRRTMRRTHRRWRNGPSAPRTAVRAGSSGPSTTRRGSAGTTTGADGLRGRLAGSGGTGSASIGLRARDGGRTPAQAPAPGG